MPPQTATLSPPPSEGASAPDSPPATAVESAPPPPVAEVSAPLATEAKTAGDGRGAARAALRAGVKATLARHAGAVQAEALAAAAGPPAADVVQSLTSAAAPTTPVATEPVEAPAESAVSPAAETPPAGVKAPEPAQAVAPAVSAESLLPTAPAPLEPAPPEAQPEAPAAVRAEFADSLRDPAWQARFQFDPGLRRVVHGILGDPGLSPSDKAVKIAERVQRTDARMVEERSRRQEDDRLLEEDPLSYVDRVRAQRTRQQVSLEQARLASEHVARFLDLDPSDPEFSEAGVRDGEPYELGVERFQSLVRAKSPLVRSAVNEAVAQARAEHAAQLAAAQESSERALRDARIEWEAKLQAAVEEAKAQLRGGTAPPRVGVPLPPEAVPGSAKFPTLSEIRGLIGAGIRAREEAQ